MFNFVYINTLIYSHKLISNENQYDKNPTKFKK